MDWFFRQWVYGTAIPKYRFDYTVTPGDEGNWLLKASLTQSDVPQDFIGMAPLYAGFDGTIVRLGIVRAAGNATTDNVQAKPPKKSKKIAINLVRRDAGAMKRHALWSRLTIGAATVTGAEALCALTGPGSRSHAAHG